MVVVADCDGEVVVDVIITMKVIGQVIATVCNWWEQ